jgi:hypothetical protein
MNQNNFEDAVKLLSEWLDVHDEPCRYDHHGYCQSHFLQEDCIVKRTKLKIESWKSQVK